MHTSSLAAASNGNKCRAFSGKYSKKPAKQQHFPEKKLPQMFQKTAKTATFSGEKTPANVPKNHQNNNKRRRKFPGVCSQKQPYLTYLFTSSGFGIKKEQANASTRRTIPATIEAMYPPVAPLVPATFVITA